MPPLAASKSPGRSWVAPVNEPLAWPKSSDSSSVSGTAPQLMATNGPAVRGRLVVDQPRDALLADAALAGDEHGRVHLRDAPRQIEHPLHRRALRAEAGGAAARRPRHRARAPGGGRAACAPRA